jgi:rhodanese-related sulfurtransferase
MLKMSNLRIHSTQNRLAIMAVAGFIGLSLAACSSDSASNEVAATTQVANAATNESQTTATATIIDVRTPEEFAAGHLDGAINMNVQDDAFATQIATLDSSNKYIVYCRSGNRSAVATALMNDAGISQITDLGSVENASAKTGIPIVNTRRGDNT